MYGNLHLFSFSNVLHHICELFKGDFTIVILVNLLDDSVERALAHRFRVSESECGLDFVVGDFARSIFVEHSKCGLQFII